MHSQKMTDSSSSPARLSSVSADSSSGCTVAVAVAGGTAVAVAGGTSGLAAALLESNKRLGDSDDDDEDDWD